MERKSRYEEGTLLGTTECASSAQWRKKIKRIVVDKWRHQHYIN